MKFVISADELAKVIKSCAAVSSKDTSRVVVTNVELRVEQGTLSVTALDGFRMIQKYLELKDGSVDGLCVIHPSPLLTILSSAKREEVGVEMVDDGLAITSPSIRATITTYAGDFIKYAEIWPKAEREKTTIYVNVTYLCKTLEALEDRGETVALEIPHNVVTPIQVRPLRNKDRAIVLPVRVTKED